MLQFKDIKEGSRILIQNKRCVVRTLLKDEMIVDQILYDACEQVPMSYVVHYEHLLTGCREWGVTKMYKVTLMISVDYDYTDAQPTEEALQEGLDQSGGSMMITGYDLELVEVTDNDVPAFDKAKKIAELKDKMEYLTRELERMEGVEGAC